MSDNMRLIVVSGLSGSGKSVALHALEDLGYYCIDNLPAGVIMSVLDKLKASGEPMIDRVAVGIDARNPTQDIEALPGMVAKLKADGVQTDVLYLHADEDVLLKRFSESRRRHPLSVHGLELRGAIHKEREILGQIINSANLTIDTSRSSVYELGDQIRDRVDRRQTSSLSVLIESFGFKHGLPADADFVFDLRCLPNPYWQPDLRPLTGLDEEVAQFLDSEPLFQKMYEDILAFLKTWIPNYVSFDRAYLTVAIGCTGGQHRSVRMTEKLTQALREIHDPVLSRHSELNTRTVDAS